MAEGAGNGGERIGPALFGTCAREGDLNGPLHQTRGHLARHPQRHVDLFGPAHDLQPEVRLAEDDPLPPGPKKSVQAQPQDPPKLRIDLWRRKDPHQPRSLSESPITPADHQPPDDEHEHPDAERKRDPGKALAHEGLERVQDVTEERPGVEEVPDRTVRLRRRPGRALHHESHPMCR
jgi:hypothetical protein